MAASQLLNATSAVKPTQYARARLRSKAFHTSGTRHSISSSGRAPLGSWSRSEAPVASMNGLAGSLRATAVFHRRAYAPASIDWRSQRGAVSQVYFSFQLCPCGRGLVTLFHGWYG